MAINSIFCMGALLLPISFGIPDSLSPFRPLKPVCSLDSIDAYYGNWKLIFPPAILENDWLTVTKSEFVWHEFDLNIDGWRKIKKRWRPRRDGADTLFAGNISTVNKIGSRLLVSGAFTIKGTSIRNLAFLDNGQWTEFSNDTTMLPLAIQEYKGALYSNVYYTINKVYALSRWTGTTWVPIFTKIYSTISPGR